MAAKTELNDNLRVRTDEVEQYTRRNNVQIFSVADTTGEETEDAIVRVLCRDKLRVEL